MGFFDLFNKPAKAVDMITEAASRGMDGIDALVYTDEEKALIGLKIAEIVLKKSEQAIGESTAQTLSRRYMAWFIVFNAGLMSWAFILCTALDWSIVAAACDKMLRYWHFALGAVVAFYFTGALISKFKK
jgi:hypothetical protein